MAKDTIVAISTPPGRGGVGIIRLSGVGAYAIALQLNGNRSLEPKCVRVCSFYKNSKELLDQGLMLYFKAPNSFTGEDVVEIQAHGSPIVLDCLIRECLFLGARLAEPGEFSKRAFLNDKMDLTQAEAIADLISSSSETAARMALRSLQGHFSHKINAINEQLIHLRLYVEAAIDFPEEDIDFLNEGLVAEMLEQVLSSLNTLCSEAQQGVLLREGASLVIAGQPNVGKSTLINYLAGKEIAIVTNIAGTTRDVMREHILIDDMPLHIIDTAGLRESECLIEQEGIRRAWQELKNADCVLLVRDVNDLTNDQSLLCDITDNLPKEVPIIQILNKIDRLDYEPSPHEKVIYISAKTGKGIEHLKQMIKSVVGYQANEGQFLARRRHLQALMEAKNCLEIGQNQLLEHRAGELLAEDLRMAHQFMCEITGEFSSDDLLGKIFSSFCIGK